MHALRICVLIGSSTRLPGSTSLTCVYVVHAGLISQKLRDIDAAAPRGKLPPRALPDSVRRQLRLPERDGAPAARRNWAEPPSITTKEALFGEGAQREQENDKYSASRPVLTRRHSDVGDRENVRKVGAVVEINRVPKNQSRKASMGATPYDAQLKNNRMQRIASSPAH